MSDSKRGNRFWPGFFAGVLVLALLVGLSAGLWWVTGANNKTAQEESVEQPSVVSASSSASASAVVREPKFPKVSQVDRSTAKNVAYQAAYSLTTWDTAEDSGVGEAVERTKPLFDKGLAQTIPDQQVPISWPQEAKDAQAFSSPQVMNYSVYSLYEDPVLRNVKDGDGRPMERHQFFVKWNWLGRDGNTLEEKDTGVVVDLWLVEEGGQWSVVEYGLRQSKAVDYEY